MTEGVLTKAALERLDPKFVSPGLLALVCDGAPTRAILCAGAGHFARAYVTLTKGCYVGTDADASDRVIQQWDPISDPADQVVPAYGFKQSELELASAGSPATVATT